MVEHSNQSDVFKNAVIIKSLLAEQDTSMAIDIESLDGSGSQTNEVTGVFVEKIHALEFGKQSIETIFFVNREATFETFEDEKTLRLTPN